MPPINGLYTELWSCLLYSLFGTSRHASVGTFAVLSLMTGSLVDQYVDLSLCQNGTEPISSLTNLTVPVFDENCVNQSKTSFVVSATMLCGIIQMFMGILQFGRLSVLLPRHVVQAFTTVLELKLYHIIMSQNYQIICHLRLKIILLISVYLNPSVPTRTKLAHFGL